DVEAAEDAAVLRHQLHAGLRDRVARAPGDLDAVEFDRTRARRGDAPEALGRRALAGAVAAEPRHHPVRPDAHRDVEEDVRIPVVAVESGDLEQTHAARTPPR